MLENNVQDKQKECPAAPAYSKRASSIWCEVYAACQAGRR